MSSPSAGIPPSPDDPPHGRYRRLSIIIPVYNEASAVGEVLDAIAATTLPLESEIVVVDDGSTDGTGEALDAWQRKMAAAPGPHEVKRFFQPNSGKGSALILGLGHATGDLVLFQDADLELDPRLEYTRILEPILAGRATVVFGARDTWRVPGSRLTTRLANWFLNRLTRLLYGGAVTDLETAYKCMPARVLRSLAPESTGFEIEPEITAKLLLAGHRIHEVPVSYRPRTVAQGKKIGWIDGVIAVLTLLKYRLPWMWTPPSPPDGRPDRVALALVLILAGLLVAVFGLARARVLRSVDPPGRASGPPREAVDGPAIPLDQVDLYRLRPDGATHLERRLRVRNGSSSPIATCSTHLPRRDVRAVRARDSAGAAVEARVQVVPGRRLRVDLTPSRPISGSAELELVVEATFPASLFRSGGGADLVWRLDLPARPGLPAGSTIQVELPPGIDASRIGSTGWRWQEVGRADPGGQRLIWRLRGDVPAPGSKPLIELHLPAGALPGARVVTLRGPGPYAITALFAILVVAAVGRALARSRRTGVEPALVAVLAILGGGAIFLLQPRLVEDNFSYQSYTRTALADLDLDLFDETYLYNATLAFTPDPREPIGPGGTAILLALPYAAAETFVRVARALAPPGPAGNGFSPPYVIAAALWSVLLAGVGATLIYAALRQLFDPVVSALAVLSGVLGTNLLMMCYMWTASTHLPSFVLVTSFFLLWHTTRERRSLTIWGLLGLLLGLAVQVRPQNVALVALPLWELVPTYWAIRGDDRRRGLAGLVVVFVFLVIGFSPQAVVWRAREGSAGLDLYGVSKGRFTGPLDRIIDMFVARPGRLAEPNGLLTAQPVLVPALLGLPLLAVRARRWTLELAFFLASQILIVASYEVWWGRVWYATPYLISCTLAFCLGLGATLEVLRRRVPVAVLAIVLLVAAGWNIRGAIVQQAHEQTALDVTEAAFVDLVGDLMEPPSPETTDHFKARGSDFAMIWRGLVDAWQERSPARALVLVGVIVGLLLSMVALARYLIARVEAASVRPLRVRRILVVLVAIVATAEVLLIVAARRTGPAVPCSRSWDRPSREIHLAYSALTPEQRNLKKSVKPDLPVQLIYLVTFLRDLRDAPQGLVVAELIATDLTGERWVFPVRAGLETAVHDRDLPGPSPSHGQARICHSWWNRDGSSVHYWGHAYGMVARLPSARRLASVELRFTADRGALIPLLFVYRGSSRPCLAPTDPDRPRDRDPDRSW